jgi:hypothetical protein
MCEGCFSELQEYVIMFDRFSVICSNMSLCVTCVCVNCSNMLLFVIGGCVNCCNTSLCVTGVCVN